MSFLASFCSRFLGIFLLAAFTWGEAIAATYQVNSAADSNTGSGNRGALRWCLSQCNNGDIIEFDPAISEIIITSPLPPITQQITIRGNTSNGNLECPRLVTLNGQGLNAVGLQLRANNIRITALRIINFAQSGIEIQNATDCVIENCVIAGNLQYQIAIANAPRTHIKANKIGVTCDAKSCHTWFNPAWACSSNPTSPPSLNRTGLRIESSNNFIIDSGNIIGCSCHIGVEIIDSNNGIIQDNQIGYNPEGNIGNRFHGIRLRGNSQNNRIFNNTIAYSDNLDRTLSIASNGIDLLGENAKWNTIENNSIFCNSGKGIQIRNGLPSLNGNETLQEPEIISAYYCSDGRNLAEGAAYQPNVKIEIYQSLPSCNCSGWRYLGTVRSGNDPIPGSNPPKYAWNFNQLQELDFSAIPLQITATATDAPGNTSEFALCQIVCTLTLAPGLKDTVFCESLPSFLYDVTPFIQTPLSYQVTWKRLRDENDRPVNESDTIANRNLFTSKKLGTWRIRVVGCNGNCIEEKQIKVCTSPNPVMNLPLQNIAPSPVSYTPRGTPGQQVDFSLAICQPTRLVFDCIGEIGRCTGEVGGCQEPYTHTWFRISGRQNPNAQPLRGNDSTARAGTQQELPFLEVNPRLCGAGGRDTFLLQTRNRLGCLSQTVVAVKRNCRPSFTLGARRQESCERLTLTAVPLGSIGIPAGSTFEWLLDGRLQQSGVGLNPITLPGIVTNGQLVCRVQSPEGCVSEDTILINIKPAPTLPNFPDIKRCQDVKLLIDAEPQVSYSWSAPPLPAVRGNYFEIRQQAGLVELRVKVRAENQLGCVTEREFNVSIAPGFKNCPSPNAFTLCPGQTQDIIAERPAWATDGIRFTWRTGSDILATEQALKISNNAPLNPTPSGIRYGENTIILQQEETTYGCSLACALQVKVSPPIPLNTLRPQTVCEGGTLSLQATPPCAEPCQHNWERLPFGNIIGNGSTLEIPNLRMSDNGQRIRLSRINRYGCVATSEIPLQVAPIPKIEEIIINPDPERAPIFNGTYNYKPGGKVEPSVFRLGSRVTFDFIANKPQSVFRCQWNYFDADCQAPVIIPARGASCVYNLSAPGLALVSGKNSGFCGKLSICDTVGCCAEQTFIYYVVEDVSVKPNCNYITPGAGPPCDRFYVVVANYKDYNLKIFDRWGALVHTCTTPEDENARWDGRCSSGDCQTGTYFWALELTTLANEKITRTGSITLLK
jgi:gliding motility-associated-like protein